jgi:hypothetical protein
MVGLKQRLQAERIFKVFAELGGENRGSARVVGRDEDPGGNPKSCATPSFSGISVKYCSEDHVNFT